MPRGSRLRTVLEWPQNRPMVVSSPGVAPKPKES
jgi:hypothetical protein